MFRTLFEVLRFAFSELANKVKKKRIRRAHRVELERLAKEERERDLRKKQLEDELITRRMEGAIEKREIEENPYD